MLKLTFLKHIEDVLVLLKLYSTQKIEERGFIVWIKS